MAGMETVRHRLKYYRLEEILFYTTLKKKQKKKVTQYSKNGQIHRGPHQKSATISGEAKQTVVGRSTESAEVFS